MLQFPVNNHQVIDVIQDYAGADVTVYNGTESYKITAAEFVMLLNLYRYTKAHDLKHSFINPNGKKKEDFAK